MSQCFLADSSNYCFIPFSNLMVSPSSMLQITIYRNLNEDDEYSEYSHALFPTTSVFLKMVDVAARRLLTLKRSPKKRWFGLGVHGDVEGSRIGAGDGKILWLQGFVERKPTWLVVWLPSILFSHILGMSSSQLTFIFFRGVQTTSYSLDGFLLLKSSSYLGMKTDRYRLNRPHQQSSLWRCQSDPCCLDHSGSIYVLFAANNYPYNLCS